MRRLVVNLDDDLDLWLTGKVNQNDTVRKALKLYKGDITTDTVEGMRVAYARIIQLLQKQTESYNSTKLSYLELHERFIEQYELVEKLHAKIEELSNR